MYAHKCAKSKMCSKNYIQIYRTYTQCIHHVKRTHKCVHHLDHMHKTHVKKCRKYAMYAQINSLMNNKSVVSEIEMYVTMWRARPSDQKTWFVMQPVQLHNKQTREMPTS